jgi:hypothetical protein
MQLPGDIFLAILASGAENNYMQYLSLETIDPKNRSMLPV